MIKKIGMVLILFISVVLMVYGFQLKGWSSLCVCVFSIPCIPVFWKMEKKYRQSIEKFYEMSDCMEQFLYSFQGQRYTREILEDCKGISIKNSFSGIYNSRKLHFMHCILFQLEQIESDTSAVTDILLKELQMWKQQMLLYTKKKRIMIKEIFLACILALLLCLLTRLLLPFDFAKKIVNITIYQVSTAVVYTAILALLLCVFHSLSYIFPDSRKGSADSIEDQFFYWMMSVLLYFQRGSMYHAIQQSGQEWENDFQKEIQKLQEGIYEMPDSPVPYVNFFGDRDLPQIHMGMRLLYSLSRRNDRDAGKRILLFVKQNFWRLDQIETDRCQSRLSRLHFIRQIPMVFAGGKIVLDAFAFVWIMAHNAGF